MMLWSSLSKIISPSYHHLADFETTGGTFTFDALGVDFNFISHLGHSKTMFLDVSFCSSFRLTTAGSPFDSSKSSGIGFLGILLLLFFFGGI